MTAISVNEVWKYFNDGPPAQTEGQKKGKSLCLKLFMSQALGVRCKYIVQRKMWLPALTISLEAVAADLVATP